MPRPWRWVLPCLAGLLFVVLWPFSGRTHATRERAPRSAPEQEDELRAPARVLLPVLVGVPAGVSLPERVSIRGDGIEETAVTLDTQGRGQLRWPAGRRTAQVRARGFKDATVEILAEPDSPAPVRLALERR